MGAEIEIIKKYCGDVEERIRVCRDRSVAEFLRHRLCDELNAYCTSPLMRHVLRSYIDQYITKVFDKNGKNKYLENHDA